MSLEGYTGGARVKNLHVKIRGVNKLLHVIIININRAFKKTRYISHAEKSESSSTVSKKRESS